MAKSYAQLIDERIAFHEEQKRVADANLAELRLLKVQSAESHVPVREPKKTQGNGNTALTPPAVSATPISLKDKTLLESAETVLQRFPGKTFKLAKLAEQIYQGGYKSGRGKVTPQTIATGLSKTLSVGISDGSTKKIRRVGRGEYASI